MGITTILFDADGVVQRPLGAEHGAWRKWLDAQCDIDQLVAAVFEAERPALVGQADFRVAFSEILSTWGWRGTVEDGLAAWTAVEVSAEVAEMVRSMRRSGFRC